ncbi:MAG: MFS transporter [Ligilactobacillus ruminis]|nr:MFS transporter [Ligilactobacillus ruminis]
MTIAFVITALVLILNELAKKISSTTIITICIIAYLGISLYAYIMKTQLDFWILAITVGMFHGPIQALSRSYFGKIIRPKNQASISAFTIFLARAPQFSARLSFRSSAS